MEEHKLSIAKWQNPNLLATSRQQRTQLTREHLGVAPRNNDIGVGFGAVAADTLLPFRDVLHLIYKNVVVLTIYQAGIYISFKVIAVLNILEHPFLLVYIDNIRIWLAAVACNEILHHIALTHTALPHKYDNLLTT